MKSGDEIQALLDAAEQYCAPYFAERDRIERIAFRRVQRAFSEERVQTSDFAPSTGYGYNDMGRDKLDRVFARALECEDAIVRPQIVSGTHALAAALFGLLRPGDILIAATGKPYDTLDGVIGYAVEHQGSLRAHGIGYKQIELDADGAPDLPAIRAAITDGARVVAVQRSRGYAARPSLMPEQIDEIANEAHALRADAIVLVDNCYGEFTREHEPLRADLLVGSLIKNPGGGLAPTGGYIAGRADLVERVADRLTSPGIGREVGSYAGGYRLFYQGLYAAPHAVAQASRIGILTARVFEMLGYETNPRSDAPRGDIVQAVRLRSEQRVKSLCRAVQEASPVDAFAVPESWDMPGYSDQVIMAAGTFVSGASIELSADAPMRPPYDVYIQGGLTLAHGRIMLENALRYI
ncbi:MAG: methionine gamma-lyase family protein [Oscillospiraceae bacterium]|jgi:cystathionine beta-lyase family protein involved in aluminum resistance|nr:methionine gamma-lyase family protein [Oscillospiraceae bacterium]